MQSSERSTKQPVLNSDTRAELASLKIDRNRTPARGLAWLWYVFLAAMAAGAFYASPRIMQLVNGVEVTVAIASLDNGGAKTPSGNSAPELSAAGYVIADRQSTLASKATGMLIKLNVKESQKIAKGDVIAEVDHRELDANKAQLEADIVEARADAERLSTLARQAEVQVASVKMPLATLDAQVKEMQITLADAKRRFELEKGLAERDALPASQVDDRRTEVQMAQAKINTAGEHRAELEKQVTVAEAQAISARSAYDVAKVHIQALTERIKVLNAQLADCFVLAPYDAVVTEKLAEIGEIVAPLSIGGSMAKGSIVTVADWNSLQAEVDVAEAYIAQVKPGGRASITVDALPDKVFPGRVQRILPHANRTKATVEVRVEFLKRDDQVLPEMGVRVKFIPDDAPPGAESGLVKPKIVVPLSAVQGTPGKQFVWVVSDNLAKKRVIEPGETRGTNVEIKSGLASGEIVVVTGTEKLTEDNQKVKY